MSINVEDVKYIARLSRLRFTEVEAELLVEQFEQILSHFKSLDKLQLDDIDLNSFDKEIDSSLREDSNLSCDDKVKLFMNVKSMRDSYIQVPKIIE